MTGDSSVGYSNYPIIALSDTIYTGNTSGIAQISYTNSTGSNIRFSYSWSANSGPSDTWGSGKCHLSSNLDGLLDQNGGAAIHNLMPGATLTFDISVQDCNSGQDEIGITFHSPLSGQSASNLALTASSATQTQGQGSVSAQLTDANSAPVSGRAITFQSDSSYGTTTLGSGVTDSTGTATVSTASLGVGSYQMTASYAGDAAYADANSNTVNITIIPNITPSNLALVFSQDGGASWASGGSVLLGRALMLKASVNPIAATGIVVFKLTNTTTAEIITSPAQTVTNGNTTFTTAPLTSLGAYTVQASFTASSSNYSNSTSATLSLSTQHVNPLSTGTTGATVMASVRAVTQVTQIQTQRISQRLERLHDDDIPSYSNGIGILLPNNATGFSDPAQDYALRNTDATAAIDKNFDAVSMGIAKGQKADGVFSALPFNVWTSGSVQFGHQTSADGASNDHFSTTGLGAGADMKLSSKVRGGIAVSFSGNSTRLNGDGSSSKALLMTGAGYSSWRVTDHVFIDTLLGYGDARFTSHRYDSNAGSFFNGARKGSMAFGALSVSYDQKAGALKYAVYTHADFTYSKLNAFSENGDPNYTLALQKTSFASQSTSLGLRGQYDFAMSWGTLSPLARLEYSHTFNGKFMQNMAYMPSTPSLACA
eukprot:gene9601-9678_t